MLNVMEVVLIIQLVLVWFITAFKKKNKKNMHSQGQQASCLLTLEFKCHLRYFNSQEVDVSLSHCAVLHYIIATFSTSNLFNLHLFWYVLLILCWICHHSTEKYDLLADWGTSKCLLQIPHCHDACNLCFNHIYRYIQTSTKCRADPRLAPSQWKMLLQSNPVSHSLGTNLESALKCIQIATKQLLALSSQSWNGYSVVPL